MRKWFIAIMLLAFTSIAFAGCLSKTELSEEEKINNKKDTIDITGITITSPTPIAQEPAFAENVMLTYSISALDITFDYPSNLKVKSENTSSVDLVSDDGMEELYVGFRDLPDGITLGEVIESYSQTANYSESYSSYGNNWYMISGEVLEEETDTSIKNNMISNNPCMAVTLPKRDKGEVLYFTPEQANQFLEAVKETKHYPLYVLEMITGLRLGEIVALRWENVDLDEKRIDIKLSAAIVSKEVQSENGVIHSEVILQSPKTKKSIRTLYIEEPLVSMLKNLRKEQLQKCMLFGDAFNNSGFVFTNDYGNMLHPRTIQDHFKRAIKKVGLPNLHFHSLRHTAASMMLFNGVDIKTVQEILGHEDIQTTLGIYTHIMEETKRDAQKTIYSSLQIKEHMEYIA